ncbi:ABC transporter type 1, transmembrane domain MetI-like [Paracoccaceae bacterium]
MSDRQGTSGARLWPVTVWVALLGLVLGLALAQLRYPGLHSYPASWTLPMTDWLNILMEWFVDLTKPFFRAISWLMGFPMRWVADLLAWLPWSVFMVLAVLIAHRAGRWPLAVFTGGALFYVLGMGLWPDTMNSLALVAVSVPLAVGLGFGLGVAGFFSPRVERFLTPMMDITQTVPAFAYLLPILMLFGFGPVVGLIAGVIFAFPPMVKNTIVGLREVPSEIIESGLMSGATPAQLFFLVRCRAGLRQILLGVNQTTMAALSMIIIASIIGGSEDIGWRVLSTLRKAEFGESLIAGIVIALMAMVLDRITHGLAVREPDMQQDQGFVQRHRFGLTTLAAAVAAYLAAQVFPELLVWPETWTYDPSSMLNSGIEGFVIAAKPILDAIKNFVIFTLILPLKIGLLNVVGPFTWGFTATGWHAAGYGAMILALAGYAFKRGRIGVTISVLSFGLILFFGLTNLTWPGASLLLVWFGYRSGGMRLGLWTAAALGFILVSGSYDKAVLSVQLCGLAILVSFLVGSALGVLAAESEWFSRLMRPINDTLQTMPPFVLLIPIIMIFKIGEFSALLAIISYAIVAPIRYTEYGTRNVPKEVVEASTSLGCTPRQLLWRVKIPLAMPNIMLGLNQAIMFGISMLVITALVGTDELGQVIYIGLSKGNFGIGFLAGIAMAVIAILADQFCRAWQRRIEAGLTGAVQ